MNRKPTYENTGILTIHGKEFRIDTYYPNGKAQPNYAIFHVWERNAIREGDSLTFASEDGFIHWLEQVQAPVQRGLF